ncbi:MAG: aminoacyl-tRNA hydrolase [Actinomycetia bacterium]|nr:aminoacyl-tRNA hydrolase [Actinomycetes bacterium]
MNRAEVGGDLVVASLVVPAAELVERFSRSSGPGGQSVNTADSRVELSWDLGASAAVSEAQRVLLTRRLASRLAGGVLTIAASEHRSQLRNRQAARVRLAALIEAALTPPRPRRPTRPSLAAKQARLAAKRRRSELKAARRSRDDG